MISALVRHARRGDELRARGWRRYARMFVQIGAVATIATSVALVGVSLIPHRCGESRHDRTKLFLNQLAYEAFPAWQASQGDTSCPTMHDLLRGTELPRDQIRDAWGQPIEIRCGEPLPGSVHGIFLRSAGPDGEFGTDDDVTPSPL